MLHTPNYLYDGGFSAASPYTSTLGSTSSFNSSTSWLPSSSPSTSFNSQSTTSTNRFSRRRRRTSKSTKSSPTSGRIIPVQDREDIAPQKVYPSPPNTPSSSSADVDIDGDEQDEDSMDVEDVDGNVELDPDFSNQHWTEELMSALPSISEDSSASGTQTIVPILSDTSKPQAPPSPVHTRKHSIGQYFQYPSGKATAQAIPQPTTAYYPHFFNALNPTQPAMPYYLPTPPTQTALPSQPLAPVSHVPGYTMPYQQWPAQVQPQVPLSHPQPQLPGMWISLPNLGDRRMTWHAGLPGYSHPAAALTNQPNPKPGQHQPQHSFTWPPANSATQATGFYTTYPVPNAVYDSYYSQQYHYAVGSNQPQAAQAQVVSTEGDGSGWITGITLKDTRNDPQASQVSLPSQVSQSDTTDSKPLIYS